MLIKSLLYIINITSFDVNMILNNMCMDDYWISVGFSKLISL